MPDDTVTAEPAVRFLTVAEVARRLRLSKMSVYRLIKDGRMSAKRFGRAFRVTEAAYQAYLDGAEYAPEEQA